MIFKIQFYYIKLYTLEISAIIRNIHIRDREYIREGNIRIHKPGVEGMPENTGITKYSSQKVAPIKRRKVTFHLLLKHV